MSAIPAVCNHPPEINSRSERHRTINLRFCPSQSTVRRGHLCRSDTDPSKFLPQSTRQFIHSLQRNIKPCIGVVNRQHINAFLHFFRIRIRQLPTRPTVGRVPSCDGLSAADIWEFGEGIESGEVFGLKTVRPVGANNLVEGSRPFVVYLVVAHRGGEGYSWEGQSDNGSNGCEFHC